MLRRAFVSGTATARRYAGRPSPASVLWTAIALTVSDLDRSVDFYSRSYFEKWYEFEVAGPDYEHLQGVFGLRMRTARMRLGGEFIELTEYLAPKGELSPADTRSQRRWFQHVALIVSDMDRGLRVAATEFKVQHASPNPQRLPDGIGMQAALKRSTFAIRTATRVEILHSPPAREIRNGIA